MAGVELMPCAMPATRSSHPCGPSSRSGTPAVSRARIEQHEGHDAGDGAPLPGGQPAGSATSAPAAREGGEQREEHVAALRAAR